MLLFSRKLTRHRPSCSNPFALQSRTRPVIAKQFSRCSFQLCMSSARSIAKSPESRKRRRLGSPCAFRSCYSNMPPMLVQEVDDDATPSTKLDLTEVESTFRTLLLDVAEHIDKSPAEASADGQHALPLELTKESIILRFTGGWVRDKLLGVPSHDIDVAINKLTGYQFGLRMKEYLEIPGNLEKYGLESLAANEKQSQKAGSTQKSKTVGGLHKIEANPEKSKHLETTTVRILGLDVDFVNLRKETYSDESRNPQMEFGTPEEDALRRDATVNAMFYNINTQTIEDFTGRGHEDMRQKFIRTPLEPYQTFKDDPLRVLRLIRFASRLEYTIDPAALEAMGNDDIRDALRRKISRERVGTELEKALNGPDPHEAMRLIYSLDLYKTIFSDPAVTETDHYEPDIKGWRIVIDTLRDAWDGSGVLQRHLIRGQDEHFLAWQLAALIPYRDAPQPEPLAPGKKAPPPIPVVVAREGVKATNKTCDVIYAAVHNQAEISRTVEQLHERKRRPDRKVEGDDLTARDVLGLAIRRWGASWRSQVVYSMLAEIATNSNEVQATERRYAAFVEHLDTLNILDACALKPLLDGTALAKAIGAKPGPWMKDALDVVMAWQLRNPGIDDPKEAIEAVKSQQSRSNGELQTDLIRHFLKLTIRPLFIKAKPDSVTNQGRKLVSTPLPKKLTMETEDESVTKPWKSERDAYVLDLLGWTVRALDKKIAAEVWHLLVPPILTLIDDWEPKYTRLGAACLHSLLQSTPPALLKCTGLGEVFEEALTPCLTSFPPLTPEKESLDLLSAVYPILLTLAYVRFPETADNNDNSSTTARTSLSPDHNHSHHSRTQFLDSILRRGIISSHPFYHTYPSLVTLQYSQLATYLDALGIDSVKHLKYLLPLLSSTLLHPLASASASATASEEMLLATLAALQAVIGNCWPRIVGWRGEVLKGVVGCWVRLGRYGEGEGSEAVGEALRDTVRVLRVVVVQQRIGVDWEKEQRMLEEADGRVKGLFDDDDDGRKGKDAEAILLRRVNRVRNAMEKKRSVA